MFTTVVRTKCLLIAVAVSLLGANPALVQGYVMGVTPVMPRNNRVNPNAGAAAAARQMETPFQGSYTIEAIGSRGLEIVFDNGSKGLVAPDKFCKIEVTGSADPAFLKPGLLVKFNAQLDKKNRATAPVSELEIVTLQTAKSPEKGGGLAADDKGSKKAEKTASTETSGTVLGQVTEFKNNELSVQTSAGAIKAELAANPTIKVHVNE